MDQNKSHVKNWIDEMIQKCGDQYLGFDENGATICSSEDKAEVISEVVENFKRLQRDEDYKVVGKMVLGEQADGKKVMVYLMNQLPNPDNFVYDKITKGGDEYLVGACGNWFHIQQKQNIKFMKSEDLIKMSDGSSFLMDETWQLSIPLTQVEMKLRGEETKVDLEYIKVITIQGVKQDEMIHFIQVTKALSERLSKEAEQAIEYTFNEVKELP